jgi:hypothetical protein
MGSYAAGYCNAINRAYLSAQSSTGLILQQNDIHIQCDDPSGRPSQLKTTYVEKDGELSSRIRRWVIHNQADAARHQTQTAGYQRQERNTCEIQV